MSGREGIVSRMFYQKILSEIPVAGSDSADNMFDSNFTGKTADDHSKNNCKAGKPVLVQNQQRNAYSKPDITIVSAFCHSHKYLIKDISLFSFALFIFCIVKEFKSLNFGVKLFSFFDNESIFFISNEIILLFVL